MKKAGIQVITEPAWVKLVAYDAKENKATIQVEENLIINTNSENLKIAD